MFCTTRLPVARYVLRFTRRALRFTRHVVSLVVCLCVSVRYLLRIRCASLVGRHVVVARYRFVVVYIALWSCMSLCVARCALSLFECSYQIQF